MSKELETGSGTSDKRLHPILSKTSSNAGADDTFRTGPMRPRANTDPSAPRPKLKVRFDLPEGVVDDCSDEELETLYSHCKVRDARANTEEGAFYVYTSPPRQRANTLPPNMFRRKVKDRPPTPPPSDKIPLETFHRHYSEEMASFCPHKLTKVTEDVFDVSRATGRKGQQIVKSMSPSHVVKHVHIPGSSSPNVRHSRNAVKSTRNSVDSPSPKRAGTKGMHSHRTSARDVIHLTV